LAELRFFIEGNLVTQSLFAYFHDFFRSHIKAVARVHQRCKKRIHGGAAGNGVKAIAESVAGGGLNLRAQRIFCLLLPVFRYPVSESGGMIRSHGAGKISHARSFYRAGIMRGKGLPLKRGYAANVEKSGRGHRAVA